MEKVFRIVPMADSDDHDIEYWKSKSPEEKLDVLQRLREEFYTFKNESRKRFQRVYRIIEQK